MILSSVPALAEVEVCSIVLSLSFACPTTDETAVIFVFFSQSAQLQYNHIRILHNIFSSYVNFTIFRQYFLLKSLNNLSYSDIQSTDWLAFSYDFDALKEKLSLYWPYWALVTLKMRPFLVPTVCRIG